MTKPSIVLGSTTLVATIVAIYFWQQSSYLREQISELQKGKPGVVQVAAPDPEPPPPSAAQIIAPQATSPPSAVPEEKVAVSAAQTRLIDDSARYVASFKAGVYREEQMPQFVADYFLSSVNEFVRAQAVNTAFEQEPVDAWAFDMEQRLRDYIGKQPEFSSTRITIGCRASQCQVQVIELHESVGHAGLLFDRLRNEPSFKTYFRLGPLSVFTPLNLGAAHYSRLVLRRRVPE